MSTVSLGDTVARRVVGGRAPFDRARARASRGLRLAAVAVGDDELAVATGAGRVAITM